ncbi:MAG: hypothetical protein ABJG78_16810 [Cyclobacteriaceae bacterium]
MQKIMSILVLSFIFISCEPDCSASPSCIAPPEGTFEDGKTNLAVSPSIIEEVEPSSFQDFTLLDSVVVHIGNEDIIIKQFYHWVTVEEDAAISSIDFHYGEESTTVKKKNFEFRGMEESFGDGGYILGAVKEEEMFFISVEQASQDLIDGVCNDTFDC